MPIRLDPVRIGKGGQASLHGPLGYPEAAGEFAEPNGLILRDRFQELEGRSHATHRTLPSSNASDRSILQTRRAPCGQSGESPCHRGGATTDLGEAVLTVTLLALYRPS